MTYRPRPTNRRAFLKGLGWAFLLGTLRPTRIYASYLTSRYGEIYRRLGVRPLINAAGTYTFADLSPGRYFIREQVPAGFVQSAGPDYYTVVVAGTGRGAPRQSEYRVYHPR